MNFLINSKIGGYALPFEPVTTRQDLSISSHEPTASPSQALSRCTASILLNATSNDIAPTLLSSYSKLGVATLLGTNYGATGMTILELYRVPASMSGCPIP